MKRIRRTSPIEKANRFHPAGRPAAAFLLSASLLSAPPLFPLNRTEGARSVTVPIVLDHNRMMVEAEILGKDGNWRGARLWVDTGNPVFFMSGPLASALGVDLPAEAANREVPPPAGVRIGGMPLDFTGVKTMVRFAPHWLFSASHNDANLPSSVLMRYRIVFDYPGLRLTLADPGDFARRGERVSAAVHPGTGVVQMDAVIGGDSLSFAFDNGASYSFADESVLARLSAENPEWPRLTGAIGCANMWGAWPPEEQDLTVMRLPEIVLGKVRLQGIGVVGVPRVSPGGPPLGAWYSSKTARPVDGFLGPNAFKSFRVEIDYGDGAVYFEKTAEFDARDMDLVGLTLRPEPDGGFSVLGVSGTAGEPAVAGVEPGDRLIRVGDLDVGGATFGTVVDALRGRPGDVRVLTLERNGKRFRIEAAVRRFL